MGSDGMATLAYSIENVKRDEICQNEDQVALPDSTELRSVFFSDSGVSCISFFISLWWNVRWLTFL